MPVVGIVLLFIVKLRLILAMFSTMVDNIPIVNYFLRKIATAIIRLVIIIRAIALINLWRGYLRIDVAGFHVLFFERICLPDAIDNFLILILKLLNPLLEFLKLLGQI